MQKGKVINMPELEVVLAAILDRECVK